MLETTIDMFRGEKFCRWFSNEPKNIKIMKEYLEERPKEVKLVFDKTNQEEGGMEILCPAKWFKTPKPPKKMSEENKAKAAERMRRIQEERRND